MSSSMIQKVKCPKCGCKSNFIIWKSINTVLDPDMKEKVRSKEAFRFVCPECGAGTIVCYACLYHQMEDSMMIYCVHDKENYEKAYEMFQGEGIPDMIKEMQGEHYLYRVVLSYEKLCEKLKIFDCGLDDRAVELAKVFYMKIAADQGVKVKDIFFDTDENGEQVFVLFDEDSKYAGTMKLDQEAYGDMVESFLQGAPDIRDDRFDIGFSWAIETIREWNRKNKDT